MLVTFIHHNFCQAIATGKSRKCFDRSHTTRDGNAGKTAATHEHIPAKGCDALWYNDFGKATAIRKCAIANVIDAVRDGDARQIAAIIKSEGTDGGNTLRDGDARQIATVSKCAITNGSNTLVDYYRLYLRRITFVEGRVIRHCAAAGDRQHAVIGQHPVHTFTAGAAGDDLCRDRGDRGFCYLGGTLGRFSGFGGGLYGGFHSSLHSGFSSGFHGGFRRGFSSFGGGLHSGFSRGFAGGGFYTRFRRCGFFGCTAGKAVFSVDMLHNFQLAADQIAVHIPAGIAVGVEGDDFLRADLGLYGFVTALAVDVSLVGYQLTGQRLSRGIARVRMLVDFDLLQATDQGGICVITVAIMGMNHKVGQTANQLMLRVIACCLMLMDNERTVQNLFRRSENR